MKLSTHLERAFLPAVLAFLAGVDSHAAVTIDVGTKLQKISGFGASTAWGSTMSTSDADQLWSTTTGAGLSLHRIRIAPDQTTSETNIAKMAVARGATVWATPWTPPSSLKVGETKANVMGLLAKHQEYATRLLNFTKTMKANGVPIYAVSAQNEPDAKVDYESCKISPDSMVLWVGKYLGPTFAGSGVKVMSPESQNWWGIANYWPKMKADADAMKYTDIVATHEYGGTVKAYPDIAASGKEFWQTEIYDTQGPADPGMGSALRTFKLIHEALTIANMNAWHFWWVYPSTTDNGALWDKATNKASKRLWVMGNFSRFVRPGYVRVASSGTPASGVSLSAYANDKDGKLVIVAANTNTVSTSQEFTIKGTSTTGLVPWTTDDSRSLVSGDRVAVIGNAFAFSLPARSVTTLILDMASSSVDRGQAVPAGGLRARATETGFRFDIPASGAGRILVVAMDGRVVSSTRFESGTDMVELPRPTADGIYEVRAEVGDRNFATRIVTSR